MMTGMVFRQRRVRGSRARRWTLASLIACGVAAVIVAAVTAAFFVDRAAINIGAASSGSLVGAPEADTFGLGIIDPVTGRVTGADLDGGFDLAVDGAGALAPGGTLTVTFTYFNNARSGDTGELTFAVEPRGDATVAGAPNIAEFLRFSASQDGTEIIADGTPLASANATVPSLTARGGTPLYEGDDYVAGAEGSFHTATLHIFYSDSDPSHEDFNGGQTALKITLKPVSPS
jgi:hypothetical protein